MKNEGERGERGTAVKWKIAGLLTNWRLAVLAYAQHPGGVCSGRLGDKPNKW